MLHEYQVTHPSIDGKRDIVTKWITLNDDIRKAADTFEQLMRTVVFKIERVK